MSAIPHDPIALAPGEEMPTDVVGPMTRTDFVRYAGAGGDLNPIHHDEEFATENGLPSVFGMGMLPAGILGSRLARWVGPDNIRSFGVRFTGQYWPGDELTFSGGVTGVGEEGGVKLAQIELACVNQKGEDVLRGSATAVVA